MNAYFLKHHYDKQTIKIQQHRKVFSASWDMQHWLWHEAIEICVALRIVPNEGELELLGMPRSKSSYGVEFIQFRLDASDEPIFHAWWDKEAKKVSEMVQTFVEQGYKLSISPDFDNACIIVSVTGKDCEAYNKGKCYTSRADTWLEAIGLAAYKHFVLAQAKEWPESQMSDSWG